MRLLIWASPLTQTLQHLVPPPPFGQTNVSVCSSLGQPFVSQFNLIFLDMLAVYK